MWVIREWTNDEGHLCRAVVREELAALHDEELRATQRHFADRAGGCVAAMYPINRALNTNPDAFVLEALEALEALEGLHAHGRRVGLNDLVPGLLLRPDLDPQLVATPNRMFGRRIETVADRIRHGER
ncbi:hypothetical protein [Embleya sp. NPDC001921]